MVACESERRAVVALERGLWPLMVLVIAALLGVWSAQLDAMDRTRPRAATIERSAPVQVLECDRGVCTTVP